MKDMKKIAYETPTASFCGLEMYGFICGSYGGVGTDDSQGFMGDESDDYDGGIDFDFL